MEKFIVLIVTYGEKKRYANFLKTVNSVINAGAETVYVVNNGCEYSLEDLLSKDVDPSILKIIQFDRNKGSKVGFTSGLKAILGDADISKDSYVLILDDDVLLPDNFRNSFNLVEKKMKYGDRHIWSLYRKGREETFDTVFDRNINFYLNAVAGFSLFRKPSEYRVVRSNINISKQVIVPWAGICLTKDALSKVKLPNSDFYVYEEDSEFSLNIKDAGYSILKSKDLYLNESSKSWFENNGKSQSGYEIYYKNPQIKGRFLYKLRNSVFLVKQRMLTSRTKFLINLIVFVVAGYIKYGLTCKQGIRQLGYIIQAVNDGLRGRLGYRSDWGL